MTHRRLTQRFGQGVGILTLTMLSVSCSGDREKRSSDATGRAATPSASRGTETPASKQTPAAPANKTVERTARIPAGDAAPLRANRRRRLMLGSGSSQTEQNQPSVFDGQSDPLGPATRRQPREQRMQRASAFDGDLRNLPPTRPIRPRQRPEREQPPVHPAPFPRTSAGDSLSNAPVPIGPSAPAPPPLGSFEGLDFATWGAGHPPDTNGDVGPQYYIETVNTSIGIFDKTSGTRVAAFTFNTFMSQGSFGNLCDTNNFGDPVVLYDTFEDRWVITDFAFQLDGGNNVVNPPGSFQCIAVSKSGDPVSGGWNFYSINTTGGLGDYPKLGIWPDGLYMSVNMFNYAAGGAFQNVRLYAFNKAQMYAGTPSIQVVSFDAPSNEFTLLPSNARLQTGTPPPGSPNYFASVFNFLNVVGVWKFHVNWNSISTSTLTGPFNVITPTNWSQLLAAAQKAPSPVNTLDTLYPRLMVQNQYSNIGGIESLWDSHTVGASGATSSQAAVRYYQVNVTGGTVAASSTQSATYSPDTTVHRFMVSTAVDRAGNLAMGYSASSSTLNPAMRYAGRLAGDPVNTITQTENSFIEGTGTQSGSCGGTCNRWGDYSAMTLDVNGCTFWYTNEYYQVTGLNDNTRIASFAFPECTPVTTGTLQGTVTTSGASPIVGATVTLGSRTTTTDATGFYQFANLPVGTYPSLTASFPGFVSQTATSIVVNQALTTTQDFTLSGASQSPCFTDTTQGDYQAGLLTNCDPITSPGDLTLTIAQPIDQSNTAGTTTGTGFGTPAWTGQTFLAAVTGSLVKAEVQLFCNGCGATPPDLTLSIRNTSGGLPTGADLASATVPGSAFASGATTTFAATFGSPATLTSGTQYALILRPVSAPAGSGYFWIRSSPSTYANGSRVLSANSGGTWSADTTRDYNFKTYMSNGYAASGNLVSGLKDANPEPGRTPTWGTLSWNASVPANTTLQFQAAGSNSADGPFAFVGPDATSGTFFSNGGSLSQFNGFRYMKYKALLTTSDSAATPTINDVTICVVDVGNPVPAITLLNPSSVVEGSGAFTLTVTGTGFVGTSVVRVNGADRVTTFGSATSVDAAILAADVLTPGSNPSITVFNPTPDGGTSNSLTLTVDPGVAPSISTHPASQTIASGSTATMSVVASGTPTLTYQWYVGTSGNTASPVGGATSSSYTTPALTTTTDYWVRVSNGFGTADSNTATISIGAAPNITTQPQSQTIASGATATMSVVASGTPTLTYQWYAGASGDTASPIGGETSSSYTTPPLTIATDYWVRVSNGFGAADSNTATITIGVAPNITTHPASQTIASGSTATMSVVASGTPTLTYQWYVGTSGNTASPVGGATSSSYTTPALTTTTDYWVRVSNGFGTADSNTATISIGVAPSISTHPASQTIASGSTATMSVVASGTPTLTYQWYVGTSGNTASPIGGATSSSYTTPALTIAASYWVRVSNLYGTADSNTATISIGVAPNITTHPQSQTIASGSTATMSVVASGTPTLTYQWYVGTSGNTASPIGGATSSSYTTPALTITTSYWVRVSSPYGTADSNTATITISTGVAPGITTQPQSQTIGWGSAAAMSVVATGTPAPTYQWYAGTSGNTASPIGGATSSSYSTPQLTPPPVATADYWVRVSNSSGMADSNTATITIVCSFLPTPGSARFGLAGGSGSATVATQAGCAWSASSPAGWIAAGGSGTGGGTMTFTAQPNPTGFARSTAIMIGTQPFVVTERVRDTITLADFDGDSKSDIAVYRPSTGSWHSLNSSTSYGTSIGVSWGLSTDTPVPGDYDGDGRIDPAIFRQSTGLWAILKSSTNYMSSYNISWGLSTDRPVPGDYDGDGKTDPAVYRPSTGAWYLLRSSTNYGTSVGVMWGLSTDLPMQGDYDGDGKTDPAIFRPSTGLWAYLKSSTNYTSSQSLSWGLSTDVAVPGDYDGDGKADPTVFRPSTGAWHSLNSSTSYTTYRSVLWGLSTDVPVPADYDGDGKCDPAIFRPSTGLWAIVKSSTNYTTSFNVSWGSSTDTPVNKRP